MNNKMRAQEGQRTQGDSSLYIPDGYGDSIGTEVRSYWTLRG